MALPTPTLPSPEHIAALNAEVDASFEMHQVPWLTQLVNQPSHTLARDDVEAAMDIIDALAEELGLRQETLDPEDDRFARHRVYSTPATRDDDVAVALVGHSDTVFPRESGFLTLNRQQTPDGERLRGPGTVDMKGGLAVALFALRAARAVLGSDYSGLRSRLICVSDEEVGSPSSRHLFKAIAPKTSAGLVFEAGREADQIITQRKGGGAFTLKVAGRAAHAGNDHPKGVNAIHALALLIPRVEALTDYERGMTVSVGIIEGGTAKNTVPEFAECTIDTRFLRQSDADDCVAALRAIAADPFPDGVEVAPSRLREVTVSLEGRVTRPPLEASPENRALMRAYETHALAAQLNGGEAPRSGGGSDANILAAAGVPCIDGLGPYGEGYHTLSEWCSLSSLKQRTLAMATFLTGLALNVS